MILRHKILYIVVFPMLLLAAYQFYTVDHVFNVINEVRSKVFVESAKEIKYASDVQFLTSLLNSTLFELDTAFESGNLETFDHSLQIYRETQQQRYFSLQKLKEILIEEEMNSTFQFIVLLDENKVGEITHIEQKILELDAHNEKIITIITRSNDSNGAEAERYSHVTKSNQLTREIVGDLAVFTNQRYIKVDETSKLVSTSESEARSTLLMIFLLGYVLSGIIIYFFYVLLILPLERFVRALEKGSMDNIVWTSLEPYREDEIGIVYHALEKFLKLPHRDGKTAELAKKEKKTRRRSTAGKNGGGK